MPRSLAALALVLSTACTPQPAPADTSSTSTSTSTESSTTSSTETSSESSTSTETGPDPCDPSPYEPCWQSAGETLDACIGACSCGDAACEIPCYEQFELELWSCIEEDAPGCIEDETLSSCVDSCEALEPGCEGECEAQWCGYGQVYCNDSCRTCPLIQYFAFSYEGSCELFFPGPTPPSSVPYTFGSFEGMGEEFVPEAGASCEDPEGYAMVWADESFASVILCPAVCELFAGGLVLELEWGTPPCE